MKIAVVLNAQRKDDDILNIKILDELAKQYDMTYETYILTPENFTAQLDQLLKESYKAILVAGGDGTVRTVAQVLVNTDIPLIILPLGTFNLFATELEYPQDLRQLFAIIKNYKTKQVDVGEVNQTIFINHSSIGFYTHILKMRKKKKNILGKSKILKFIYIALNFFNVIPIYRVTLQMEATTVAYDTCLIFIGNNYHFTDLFNFGTRSSLSSGKLAVYILHCKSRWEIVKCMMHIWFNTPSKSKYVSEFITSELVISSEAKQINVVLDGDLFKFDAPLNYKIHKKKLTVLVA